jgi:pimeloyl-ACP methyl ester carboxylesterase
MSNPSTRSAVRRLTGLPFLPITERSHPMITSADGVPIAYTVVGAGPPVVLLHGFTETSASWQDAGYVDGFLRAGRRVVLIDCRGRGGSGKPA